MKTVFILTLGQATPLAFETMKDAMYWLGNTEIVSFKTNWLTYRHMVCRLDGLRYDVTIKETTIIADVEYDNRCY